MQSSLKTVAIFFTTSEEVRLQSSWRANHDEENNRTNCHEFRNSANSMSLTIASFPRMCEYYGTRDKGQQKGTCWTSTFHLVQGVLEINARATRCDDLVKIL